MKILFIGLITEDILAQTKADELIGSFVDIGEAALEVGNICNAYNGIDIDFTVLLTHIGFEEDKKLAALLDPAWGHRCDYRRTFPFLFSRASFGEWYLYCSGRNRYRPDWTL